MKLSATFINATGNTKPFDITEGFTLQDAYNVVANDDFAPTQINIQLENMNLPSYSLGSEMPIETAYDKIGRHSTAEIMAKHKISQQDLEVLLDEGANHELEHTSSILVAMLIAQDHLYEHLDYYKRLKAAKLVKGAVIKAMNNKGRYDDGGRVSFPIYTRMKNQIDKSAVKDFLFKYPQVESVMNRYVRTPNVKAGYLMFLSEKDMNDQNLENWGATIKGSMELPNGTKIKRYNWDFGNAEGFAEVFQYLYDKQNGYAKGGEVGADLSEKMMQDAQKMSSQSYMNAYSVDIAESYMDAKNQYESHHKTDYPITLGMYVNSLHKEYKAMGGSVNNKNYYRAVTEDLGLQTTFVPQNRYEAFDNMGNPITRGASDIFMLSDKLEISASKSVGGAILGLWSMFNSNGLNPIGKKVYIYAIDKKPYLDLSHVRMADFEYLQEVRYDKPISAKRIGYFEYDQKFNEGALNFYGRISDDDPYSEMEYDIEEWEDFEQYILTLNKSDLVMYKIGGKIQFDKGGYIDEQMFADKYLLYKKRWRKINDYEDLDISEPLKIQIYLFPNDSGFLIDLYHKEILIGQFHSYFDSEEGMKNDVQIAKTFRNKGLGKILLLIAIDVSNSYLGFFESDVRGLTIDQKRVYNSLISNGQINSNLEINYEKSQELINKILKELNNPNIRFDKGGYIDEQMFADQKLQKIDGIYVVDKSGKQRDSLGNFSYKAFGQYMMRDLAKELFDEYQIRLRSDFALMINGEVITPAIKVVQMTGSHIDYLALIYNAVVVEEGVVSYVYNEDGEFIDKFTDEDRAQEYVDADDGNYIEARVEEIQYPETIISMQFDFDTHKMTFVSSMLEKNNTHEFKYGGQL